MAVPIDDVQGEIYLHLCTQVGHLFLTFANLENILTSILKLHMTENISKDMMDTKAIKLASAIYGGMRYATSRDTIKRIAATENPDPAKLEFLLGIFAQIGSIQSFRDMLAHKQLIRATDRIDGTWRLSNLFTTRDLMKPVVYEFDMTAVNAASADIATATTRLGGRAVTDVLIEQMIDDLSPIAWRYKPSMLKLVPLETLNWPQEPPPPPRSSQE